ncbi:uncharacterized protein LOC121407347 [Lytechinus variegatus]|uniref:uncharacterized protein LOC121407347 n=1 Tax=Lytechinus variegatus TaxID=7654 RepID=UPI001BB10511|nr:uncharacterized protein LOC121407347 [Lytechinus variegatus]
MESRTRIMRSSQLGLPPRSSMTVTFSRDTLERKVEANKPQQLPRNPDQKLENIRKISGKDADPVLTSLVNYHSKLLGASGRSFDLIVGKLSHLLKTNGYYLDSKYKGPMDALFFAIRNLIVDTEKSEISRTRLLENLELRAKTWGHDPLELPQPRAHLQDLPSPTKPPAVTHPQDNAPTECLSPPYNASGRYSPIPLPPVQVAPPSPDMEALTHVAKATPFPDDTDDDEEDDDQWLTTSDMTYESDSSEEFIMPEREVEDLMMESTTDLDDELSRLLAAKLPDSYKRRVNDGKPVRYTRSFLLDLWKSPYSKEMPSVLKHTISHSDVSFIIQRHAFSDPGVLFQQGSMDDIYLRPSHLKADPNSRVRSSSGRSSSGRSTPDPKASDGDATRMRALSWPQGAAAAGKPQPDVEGGGERLVQGREGARQIRIGARIDSPNPATWQGARRISEGDGQEGRPEASLRSNSPDDWRRPGSTAGILGETGTSAAILGERPKRNTNKQEPLAAAAEGEEVVLRPRSPRDWVQTGPAFGTFGDRAGQNMRRPITPRKEESLRPRSPSDWRRPGSISGLLGDGDARAVRPRLSNSPGVAGDGAEEMLQERPGSSGRHSPSNWGWPGSSSGIPGDEGTRVAGLGLSTPSAVVAGGGDQERPGSRRRSPSAGSQEAGAMKVRFDLPDQSSEDDMKTKDSQRKQAATSTHVLLTPRQILGDGAQPDGGTDMSPSTLPMGFAPQTEIPTFREVFREVIEKGITTGAPGPAMDIRAKSPEM